MGLIKKDGKYYQELEVIMLSENTATKIERNQLWTHDNGNGTSLRVWNNPTESLNPSELKGYCIPQHLYLISDEKPKKGEWMFRENHPRPILMGDNLTLDGDKKIVATSNPNFGVVKYTEGGNSINAGIPIELPKISEQFVELFSECHNNGNYIKKVLVGVDKSFHGYCKEGGEDWIFQLKIKTDNTIIIEMPEEKTYSESQVIALCKKAYSKGHYNALFKDGGEPILDNEWINENIKQNG